MKTLRESIKGNNVDSFNWHLDELERIVQNTDRMKKLLDEDGTLSYSAYIGSNPVVETLIQKGVGKELYTPYSERYDLKLVQTKVAGQSICEWCMPLPSPSPSPKSHQVASN